MGSTNISQISTRSKLLVVLLLQVTIGNTAEKIDRQAVVSRHSVHFRQIDPAAPAMVGNGNFAFTADITGLQTFPKQYSPLVPLLTQAQWAWHSFPNPRNFKYEDSLVPVDVRGKTQYYPWLRHTSDAGTWLRENPHRISLGRLSLYMVSRDGKPAQFTDLSATQQTLDLWNGALSSQFDFDGATVHVQTRVHPDLDMLIVTLTGRALAEQRLGVDIEFPGVAVNLNPDPADWGHPERHQTTVTAQDARRISLERKLDDTRYYVKVSADRDVSIERTGPHAFRVLPRKGSDSVTLLVLFSEQAYAGRLPDPAAAKAAVTGYWNRYWRSGGMVDLSSSTDPRAPELERRIVLSQYLMAVNAAGIFPPQEEGLFSNSWYGKFHLEMHLWHEGHFAPWGHVELLERSMPWYLKHLAEAKDRARAHGVQGAWWPKMVGPEGRESPSAINPFIMWQQPSPIYLAELIYRAKPTHATLDRYRDLVSETADLLASFPHFDTASGRYVLGPPIIPAQEIFPPLTTCNPAFELEYFRFGLMTAQTWRQRLGLPRNPQWDAVLARLSPLPQRAGVYVATESLPPPGPQNRDHPSFLGALGLLPGPDVDHETMRRTLQAVDSDWDLRQSWGWDYPLMAMTATRLHEPQKALDFLFKDAPNNHFGATGMTPRGEVAQTYFPSNGSLLLAVALMTAGWDGESTPAPGFPKDGRWRVRSEGLHPLP